MTPDCAHKNTKGIDPVMAGGFTSVCHDCGAYLRGSGGVNLAHEPFDVGRVCMPLVRLLLVGNLSWSQREEIAWAIQDALHEYREHQKEQEHLHGTAAANQATRGR